MTQFGFVLGNGKTRRQVDHTWLHQHGQLYVCNRAAQEMDYDVCVAVDKEVSMELQKLGHTVYTRSNAMHTPNAKLIQRNIGWSSGPVAATIAAMNGHSYVFLIGMDLISDTDRVNNLYADTQHYKTSDSPAIPHSNWVGQIDTLMKDFPNIRFLHVNPLAGFTPEQWQRNANCSIMTLEQLKTMINNTNSALEE